MAYTTGTRATSISFGHRLSEIFTGFAEAYAQWRLYRRTLAELQELSGRELDDLGLNKANIRAAAFDATYGKAR